MAGSYSYPCPGCGCTLRTTAGGTFSEAPAHNLCASCEEKQREGSKAKPKP